MKKRAILVVIILAGLAVCGISAVKIQARILQLQHQARLEADLRSIAQSELTQATVELRKAKDNLSTTEDELESARIEKESAVISATTQAARADKLSEELSTTRDSLAKAQAELKRHANNLKLMQDLQDELEVVKYEKAMLVKRMERITCILIPGPPELPQGLKGNVTAVDPKWSFFVLDAGETKGMVPDGEILINRSGRLLAKAKVTRVSENQSIANPMPGWSLAQVTEGDSFIAARWPWLL